MVPLGSAVTEASATNNLCSLPIFMKILYCNRIHLQQSTKKNPKRAPPTPHPEWFSACEPIQNNDQWLKMVRQTGTSFPT